MSSSAWQESLDRAKVGGLGETKRTTGPVLALQRSSQQCRGEGGTSDSGQAASSVSIGNSAFSVAGISIVSERDCSLCGDTVSCLLR